MLSKLSTYIRVAYSTVCFLNFALTRNQYRVIQDNKLNKYVIQQRSGFIGFWYNKKMVDMLGRDTAIGFVTSQKNSDALTQCLQEAQRYAFEDERRFLNRETNSVVKYQTNPFAFETVPEYTEKKTDEE